MGEVFVFEEKHTRRPSEVGQHTTSNSGRIRGDGRARGRVEVGTPMTPNVLKRRGLAFTTKLLHPNY